jgi:hypothetical protein
MGTIARKGTTGSLVEDPGSPRTELGERIVRTRVYRGTYTLCWSSRLYKGTAGTGDETGFVVQSCTVVRDRGDMGVMTVVWEAGASTSGVDLPPIEFSCQQQRQPRGLFRHPKYALTTDTPAGVLTKDDVVNIRLAAQGGTEGTSAENSLNALPNGTRKERALQLLKKVQRGQESYYITAFVYRYVQSYWTLPALTIGGFIETPSGPMAGLLPSGTWLRMADGVEFTGAHYKVTRTWEGAGPGNWDADLYTV